MRKKIQTLIGILAISSNLFAQEESIKTNVGSIFPVTIEENTRVMDYMNNFALTFINAMGTPYLLDREEYAYVGTSPILVVNMFPLPSGLNISELRKKSVVPWFCGEWSGMGLYGRMFLNLNYIQTPNSYFLFTLPDMNNLRKFAIATNMVDPYHQRMFAIGETNSAPPNTHIVELELQGTGISELSPYVYAPLDSQEYLDDMEIVAEYVVFATRDYRANRSRINLRLSQVENVLAGTDIDSQWQLLYGEARSVIGKVFITRLDNNAIKDFGISYIAYDNLIGQYYLYIHKLSLGDVFSNGNTVVSQRMVIPKGEEIVDIKYDDVNEVLIVLLEKENICSVFLHTCPYKTTNYSAVRLESSSEEKYYSIDTLKTLYSGAERQYVAWGGNKSLTQKFHYGGSVDSSCLSQSELNVEIVNPIMFKERKDTLVRHMGIRNRYVNNDIWMYDYENRDCYIMENQNK